MSAEDTTSNGRDCGLDVAAYVLGALENDELEAFRAHLSGCAACRDEVAALQHVADVLPGTAPALTPPHDLRQRVIGAVRAEQKGTSAGPAHEPADNRQRRPTFKRPRPAAGIAGALAAVAAAAVAIVLVASGSSPRRVIEASVRGAGSAQLILIGGRGELVVRNFPSPGSGRIYEVWLQRPHQAPAPTRTLFGVTTAGAGDVGLTGDLHGVSRVLVTSERLGGSNVPTRAPVITAQL